MKQTQQQLKYQNQFENIWPFQRSTMREEVKNKNIHFTTMYPRPVFLVTDVTWF